MNGENGPKFMNNRRGLLIDDRGLLNDKKVHLYNHNFLCFSYEDTLHTSLVLGACAIAIVDYYTRLEGDGNRNPGMA